MSNIKVRLAEMLSNHEKNKIDESQIINADILPTIKTLTENNWCSGKKKMVEACRHLIKIAESNEPIAKSFFRGIDKATTIVGNNVMKKLENGGYKGMEVIDKKEF